MGVQTTTITKKDFKDIINGKYSVKYTNATKVIFTKNDEYRGQHKSGNKFS